MGKKKIIDHRNVKKNRRLLRNKAIGEIKKSRLCQNCFQSLAAKDLRLCEKCIYRLELAKSLQ